jgi:hypothetical protein
LVQLVVLEHAVERFAGLFVQKVFLVGTLVRHAEVDEGLDEDGGLFQSRVVGCEDVVELLPHVLGHQGLAGLGEGLLDEEILLLDVDGATVQLLEIVDGVVAAVGGDDETDAFVEGEREPKSRDGVPFQLSVAQEVDAVEQDYYVLIVYNLIT